MATGPSCAPLRARSRAADCRAARRSRRAGDSRPRSRTSRPARAAGTARRPALRGAGGSGTRARLRSAWARGWSRARRHPEPRPEAGDVRSRVHNLLHVVEHEQVLSDPELGREVALDPEGVRDRRQDDLGIADRRQVDERDAVVERLDELLRRGGREARLAHAAGPRDRHNAGPVPRKQAHEIAELALAPTSGYRSIGSRAWSRLRKGGNSLVPSWKRWSGTARSLSRCSPRSRSSKPFSSGRPSAASEHLAAMPRGHHPCGAVDIHPTYSS